MGLLEHITKRGTFMKIVSSFKHLEHTPSLDEKIEKKVTKA